MIDLRAEFQKDPIFALKGQQYEFVRDEPHLRRDGSETALIVMATKCAECSKPFEAKAPASTKWLTRRCAICAKPGRRV